MRGMQRIAGLMLAAPLVAMAGDAPVAWVDLHASAWVDVDALGKAHVIEMEKVKGLADVVQSTPIAETIKERLHDRIESWQFNPATRDGVAVVSRTHLHVVMEGFDDGAGNLGVRIRSAATGPDVKDWNDYGLARAGVTAGEEGIVTFYIAYGADGKVTAAEVRESKTFSGGRFVGTASKTLRKGLLAVARRWTFVPEQVAGQPVPGSGVLPIRVCFSGACISATDASSGGKLESNFASTVPAVTLGSAVAGTAL